MNMTPNSSHRLSTPILASGPPVVLEGPYGTRNYRPNARSPSKISKRKNTSVFYRPFQGSFSRGVFEARILAAKVKARPTSASRFVRFSAALNARRQSSEIETDDSAPLPTSTASNELGPDDGAHWEDVNDPQVKGVEKNINRGVNRMKRERAAKAWDASRGILTESLLFRRAACCGRDVSDIFARTANVNVIYLTNAEELTLPVCSCTYGVASRLVAMDLFPSAPVAPTIAFSTDVLALFHDILMEGPIARRAFAIGIRTFLERKLNTFLPCLIKPLYNAYAQWRATVDNAMAKTQSCIEQESLAGGSWSTAECANICPACFYRTESEDYNSILICAVDGVSSHRRLKLNEDHAESFETLPTFLFQTETHGFRDDSNQSENETESSISPDDEKIAPCGHRFRAASKPKTMMKYDETGLMGLTCRHGQGLRYLDMTQGEAYIFGYTLFKQMEISHPHFKNFAFMYDIGCKFAPWLRKKDPDLYKKAVLGINALHVYGHALSCQVIYGPRRLNGLGESDMETNERDWSSKRHLVAAGKTSSPSRRRQTLDSQSRRRNANILRSLPRYLEKRYQRAMKRRARSSARLATIFKTPLVIPRVSGVEVIEWSDDFLASQTDSQKTFFKENRTPGKYRELENKVYVALKREQDLLAKLPKSSGWHAGHQMRKYPELVAETDKRLKDVGQTRQDWEVDGQLWTRYSSRIKDSTYDIYKAMEDELELEATIREGQKMLGDRVETEEAKQWFSLQTADLQKARQRTEKLLGDHCLTRDQFKPGSECWNKFRLEHVRDELERILPALMKVVATRHSEIKDLHSHVSGQKEANQLLSSLYKRSPAISALVTQFNNVAQKLPKEYSISLLSPSAFQPALEAETGDSIEMSQNALWNYEILQARYTPASRARGVNVTDIGADVLIWGQNANVRDAINHRLRILRANEEVALLTKERERLWRWTVYRSKSLISIASAIEKHAAEGRLPDISPYVLKDMLWEHLYLVNSWKSCEDDALGPASRSEVVDLQVELTDACGMVADHILCPSKHIRSYERNAEVLVEDPNDAIFEENFVVDEETIADVEALTERADWGPDTTNDEIRTVLENLYL